jgi:hypothetical protein
VRFGSKADKSESQREITRRPRPTMRYRHPTESNG